MDEINDNSLARRLPVVLCVLLVTSIGLMARMPWSGRFATALFDLLHAPVFCLVAWLLLWLVPATTQPKHGRIRLVLAFCLVLLSAVAEYAQQFVGRNTNWHDLVANCLGVVSGSLIFEWSLRRRRPFGRIPLITGIIILLLAVKPSVTELVDCVRLRTEFPLLDSFENGCGRWQCSEAGIEAFHAPQLATHGQFVLRWDLQPGRFPGCRMFEPPRDWTGFQRLEFDIQLAANAQVDQLAVFLKLHDELHRTNGYQFKDRFQKELLLSKGEWQHIAVDLTDVENSPSTRTMDLAKMDLLQLFAIEPARAITVYIDHVRLTESDE